MIFLLTNDAFSFQNIAKSIIPNPDNHIIIRRYCDNEFTENMSNLTFSMRIASGCAYKMKFIFNLFFWKTNNLSECFGVMYVLNSKFDDNIYA